MYFDYLPGPTTCGKPEQPPNSTLIAQKFSVGSRIEYTCDKGHLLVGPSQRSCLPTGFYSEFPPVCRCKLIQIATIFYTCAYIYETSDQHLTYIFFLYRLGMWNACGSRVLWNDICKCYFVQQRDCWKTKPSWVQIFCKIWLWHWICCCRSITSNVWCRREMERPSPTMWTSILPRAYINKTWGNVSIY